MKDAELRQWPWVREVVIDRNSVTPPVEQVVNAIRNKIALGQLRANDLLPSVRGLATKVGTTPTTISRAYQLLQREGLLTSATGYGTTVADIENLQQSARSSILDTAGQVLDQAMNSLASLGLAKEELKQLLHSRGNQMMPHTTRLVFIARRHTNLELYERQLRTATAGLRVSIECTELEDLEDQDAAALESVASADVVTSLITYRRLLAELLPATLQVRYIIADLLMAAVEALSTLPSESNVALVASEPFRTVGLGILHTYCTPERISVLRDIEADDDWNQIPEKTIIVHTFQQSERARKICPAHQRICLDFELRSDSLQRLREFLHEQSAEVRLG